MVVRDVLGHEPVPELDEWEEIAEVSMVFTGPDVGCNFGEFDASPPSYVGLPAKAGESGTYRVRVSVKGRHNCYDLAGTLPSDHHHAEWHLIQIWSAPKAPEKIWKRHRH